MAGFVIVVVGRGRWPHRKRRICPHAATQWRLRYRGQEFVLWSAKRHGITGVLRHRDGGWRSSIDCAGEFTRMAHMKKKKPAQAEAGVQHLAPVESTVLGRHQSLVNHAAVVRYDDGDVRQPGWVTIKTMGSAWVVEIKDPDTAMRLTVIQATLDDALTLASLLLDAEEAPWEPDPWLMKAKAQKKK